ncbi:MAG: phosphatidate cytidylyltransferase [Bacteroidales bacterium]
MSELLKRSITGFSLVAVMVFAILFHPLAALSLFAVICYFSLYEFYGLMNRYSVITDRYLHSFSGAYLVIIFFIYSMSFFTKWLLLPYFFYLLTLPLTELYKKENASVLNIGLALLGHLYVAMPFALLGWLGYFQPSTYQPILILAIFVNIWANDSGAYIVGSRFGKHRLFERISPKKSWEGFLGGLFMAIAVSSIFAIYIHALTPIEWIGFGIVTSISATYGDLFESFLKRSIGIKDSGNILPGHGGMLDRFDAPLFAIPAVMIYLYFFC